MTSERYHQQIKAANLVHQAVESGLLIKPERCSKCNRRFPPQELEGHHADYNKPLEVDWLCQKCHRRRHWFLRWFEARFQWLIYCKEKNVNPEDGLLPAVNKRTGAPLKKTQFEYWLTYLRGKR